MNPLPEFSVEGARVCEDSTTIITANNNTTDTYWYKWNNATDFVESNKYETPKVTADVTYNVEAKNTKTGCISKPKSFTLTKKENPELKISGQTKVCYNNPAKLSVSNSATSPFSTTYVWMGDESKTGATYTTEGIVKETKFSVTATMEGCSATATVVVDTFNTPIPKINGGAEEVAVCSQDGVKLNVSNAGVYNNNGIDAYKWDSKTSLTDATYTFTPMEASEVHSVEITDENGCTAVDDINVLIQYRPSFEVTGETVLCTDSVVVLTATPLIANATYSYVWKNKDNEVIGTTSGTNKENFMLDRKLFTKDTTIYVTATDQNGLTCDSTVEVRLTAKPNPVIVPINVSTEICRGENAIFTITQDDVDYVWTKKENGQMVTISNERNLIATIKNDEVFYLKVTKDGCENTNTFNVKMLELPTINVADVTICYKQDAQLSTKSGVSNGNIEEAQYTWFNKTANEYVNFSNTLAFTKRVNRRVVYTDLAKTYQETLDKAILSVAQGKSTFDEQMYSTIKELGSSGLKTVDYANGRSVRLDSSVRQHLKGALRNLHNETQAIFGKEFGANMIEISVHEHPAPDHYMQGKQMMIEEYEKMQNHLPFKDLQGNVYEPLDRPISELNCYHYVFYGVAGVSKPNYTDEELNNILKENEKGIELDGQKYTIYEMSQIQRRLETNIRKQKDLQIIGRTSGNKEIVENAQRKITELTHKYKQVSDISGLPYKRDRLRVSNYKRVNTNKL